MLINRDSRAWIILCLVILAAGVATYVPYARHAQINGGPSGGSWYGVIYGSVGFAMMLFALALGLKKRVRTMRIGRAYHWLQGHIWFGLLAYPIILLHCGFHWGQYTSLTQLIMWLFTIVVLSGIIGVLLQQFMPTKMMRDIRFETVYEQINHVVEQLAGEAENVVQGVVAKSGGEAFELEVVPAGVATATLPEASVLGAKTLTDFYTTQIKPYLAKKIPSNTKLTSEQAVNVIFDQVRSAVPKSMHDSLNDLSLIVEERRQLGVQKRMQHILHGWLIVHVPLSYALMILSAWHAVWALRYVSPHW